MQEEYQRLTTQDQEIQICIPLPSHRGTQLRPQGARRSGGLDSRSTGSFSLRNLIWLDRLGIHVPNWGMSSKHVTYRARSCRTPRAR